MMINKRLTLLWSFLMIVSSSSIADDNQFEQYLKQVPQNSAYVYGNKNKLPKEVLDAWISKGSELWGKLIKGGIVDVIETSMSKKNKNQGLKEQEQEQKKSFLSAFLLQLSSIKNTGDYINLGIRPDLQVIMYEYNLLPVIRLPLADKDKLIQFLKGIESQSYQKINWQKCRQYDCIAYHDKVSLVIIFQDKHFLLALYEKDKEKETFDHLLGVTLPKKSYSAEKWDTFLTANAFIGMGDALFDLRLLLEKIIPVVKKYMANKGPAKVAKFEQCAKVARDHFENAPEFAMGIKLINENFYHLQAILSINQDINSSIIGLANELDNLDKVQNSVFDFAMNINLNKMHDTLVQYLRFLAKSGETHQCTAINANKIRKSIAQISMTMGMLSQYQAVYLGLSEVKFKKEGQPDIQAHAYIISENPMMMMNMLAMVNPKLAEIKLPKEGTRVTLPAGILPEKLAFLDISLSQKGKKLNIYLGEPPLKFVKLPKPSPLFYEAYNGSKFAKILNDWMASEGNNMEKANVEVKKLLDAILSIYGGMQFSEWITTEKRGIVIDYNFKFK